MINNGNVIDTILLKIKEKEEFKESLESFLNSSRKGYNDYCFDSVFLKYIIIYGDIEILKMVFYKAPYRIDRAMDALNIAIINDKDEVAKFLISKIHPQDLYNHPFTFSANNLTGDLIKLDSPLYNVISKNKYELATVILDEIKKYPVSEFENIFKDMLDLCIRLGRHRIYLTIISEYPELLTNKELMKNNLHLAQKKQQLNIFSFILSDALNFLDVKEQFDILNTAIDSGHIEIAKTLITGMVFFKVSKELFACSHIEGPEYEYKLKKIMLDLTSTFGKDILEICVKEGYDDLHKLIISKFPKLSDRE